MSKPHNSRLNVRHPTIRDQLDHNVVTNQLSLPGKRRDREQEKKERVFNHRVHTVDYDRPELPIHRPTVVRQVLNGERATKLATYDDNVLAYIDELGNRNGEIDLPVLILWYRQAFSKQIRAAKSVRKLQNPNAKNCYTRNFFTVGKEYALHVFNFELESPPPLMAGKKTVPEILKGCSVGHFSELTRRQVLMHSKLAGESYRVDVVDEFELVSDLNGANGEVTGDDDFPTVEDAVWMNPDGEKIDIDKFVYPEFSDQLSIVSNFVNASSANSRAISMIIYESPLEPFIEDRYEEMTSAFADFGRVLPTPLISISDFHDLKCRLPSGALFLFYGGNIYMFLNIYRVPPEYTSTPVIYDIAARSKIELGLTLLVYNLPPCLGGAKKKNQVVQKKQKKKANTIRGSGAYSMGDLVNAVKKVAVSTAKKAVGNGGGEKAGSVIGKAIGNAVGYPDAGAALGARLGKHIARIIGSGDYETNAPDVAANSLINGKMTPNSSFGSSTHTTRVRHREYVQDLATSGTAGQFSNQGFALNPANAQLFPYLSQLAQNYEKFVVHGFVIELVSTTSPYNSNSAMGSVVVTATFNSATAIFVTKNAMENSEEAVSARFDRNLCYGLECADSASKEYYIDNGNTVDTVFTSPQLLNYCLVQIATAPASTFPTNSVVYEMWITYDISLIGPKISPSRYGIASWLCSPLSNQFLIGTPTEITSVGNMANFSVFQGVTANLFQVTFSGASPGNLYLMQYALAATSNTFTITNVTMGIQSNIASAAYVNTPGITGIDAADVSGVGKNGYNFYYQYYFTATGDTGSFIVESTCPSLGTGVTATLKIICIGNGYPAFPADGSV